MNQIKIDISSSEISNDILKTLLYFDTFQYPLNLEEILNFSHYSLDDIKVVLEDLITKKIIFIINNYYSISQRDFLVKRRNEGNKKAKKILIKAKKISNFISQFPFVEGVFISGSLSKGYFGKDDDIDFFIITSPNRLWVARTLLIGYKKVFLLNSKKYFCVNYFISTNALQVSGQNRFTATEFVTLIPMTGNEIYKEFQDENIWVLDYFPNYKHNNDLKPIKKNLFKRCTEFLLNGKIGNDLEEKFMRVTKHHHQNKFKKLNKSDFNIAFKGDKNISKHHPDNNQIRVIQLLNNSIINFNKKHNLSIPLEK